MFGVLRAGAILLLMVKEPARQEVVGTLLETQQSTHQKSLALCLTESLVHLPGNLPRGYHSFKIFVPDDAIEVLNPTSLIEGWQSNLVLTRSMGDQWLTERRSLALVIPSVVLPESSNVLLNPMHSRANDLRVLDQRPFTFDPRLRPSH